MGNLAELFPRMGWYNKLNEVEARLEKDFKALDSFYDMAIQEQSRGTKHDDLVDVLLRVHKKTAPYIVAFTPSLPV